MCGIAGILRQAGGVGQFGGALRAMQGALRHRGPDDAGEWTSPSGYASFTHTRLSIIDLSAAGRQPLSTSDGRLTITFNGEIYNYLELRAELEREGAQFRTRTDTEVILRAYDVHGPACVERLRGMFAFALWDERERSCLLARDPFGIKPLYYFADAKSLVFASELRSLDASGMISTQLDPQGVYGYFRSGSVPEPLTLLRDVRCLEAGHHVLWRDGRLAQRRRYWSLEFKPQETTRESAVETTRSALLDSVEHHFIADVPVGVFLSGGIDSTAIVALARVVKGKDLRTFSISFPGSPNDEGEIARRTARHFETRHEDWPLDGATARRLFEEFIVAADQPSIDGLNTFAVSKMTHERGMKVALSGLGGDELFGGYKSFRDVPRLARLNRLLRHAEPLRAGMAAALARTAKPQWRRLGEMLGRPASLDASHDALRGIFTHAEATVLASKYAGAGVALGQVPPASESEGGDLDADVVSRLEFTRYMRNQLLRDSDVMSMAWGLELRVPFLDLGLIGKLTRIPAAIRLQQGKQLLLQAVPEIPEWVAGQPKRGFLFPFERWLGAEWRNVFEALDTTCPVPTETWYRKWCVYLFEHWLSRSGPRA